MKHFIIAILAVASAVPAYSREAAPTSEIEVCPIGDGDFDLALARLSAASNMVKVGYDVYAMDKSDLRDHDATRLFSKPVIVTEINRVRHGRALSLFIRLYRAPSVETAQDDDLRAPLDKERVAALVGALESDWKSQFPC